MPTTIVFLWDTKRQAYVLTMPFLPEVISLLKLIPASERSYNPETKQWYLQEKHYATVLHIVQGTGVRVITRTRAEVEAKAQTPPPPMPRQQTASSYDDAVIAFARALPPTFWRSVYRNAVATLHPDKHNGTQEATDVMLRINVAWQELLKFLPER